MSVEILVVGQVGVANFGARRRALMRRSGLFRVAAMHDWNETALKTAAREENAQACTSYEELLAVPGLEAVVLCSGARHHAEQIVQALEKGLPVFVEKPLCSTPEELEAIRDAQRAARLPVGMGHDDHSSMPLSRLIKRALEDGDLGNIVAVEATTAHSGAFHMKPGDWRSDRQRNPGGMLFQCGVHVFHELMYYFGPIRDISARMRYDVLPTRTADAAICHLEFASGVIGSVCAYHTTPYRHSLIIHGTKANLYREDRAFHEGIKVLKQDVRFDQGYEALVPISWEKEIATDDGCGNLRSFYRAVRSGEMQYPSLEEGARAVEAVFAAERSARSRNYEIS